MTPLILAFAVLSWRSPLDDKIELLPAGHCVGGSKTKRPNSGRSGRSVRAFADALQILRACRRLFADTPQSGRIVAARGASGKVFFADVTDYGFSKKWSNLDMALALHFAHYNFCRVHQSLRVTPAMEAGITNHIWELDELVGAL